MDGTLVPVAAPPVLQLAHAFHGVFVRHRTAVASSTPSDAPAVVLRSSQRYRAALARVALCTDDELERLDSDSHAVPIGEGLPTDRGAALRQLQLLSEYTKVAGMLWHAAEVAFFHPEQTPPGPQLLQWVAEHFQNPADDAVVMQLATDVRRAPAGVPLPPALDAQLWQAVTRSVVHGDLPAAASWLDMAAAAGGGGGVGVDASVATLQAVVRAFPALPGTASAEAAKLFQAQWREWHSMAVSSFTDMRGSGTAHPVAVALLDLVAGNVGALPALDGGEWNMWFHRLSTKLLYDGSSVAVRASGVRRLVAACLSECDQNLKDPLYVALLSTLDANPAAPVNLMVTLNQLCTAAHLADLLRDGGVLGVDKLWPPWNVPFRDHVLLEYGTFLGSQPGMWRPAATYAAAVDSPPGMLLAETILAKVAPSSEALTHKLIMTANLLGLSPLAARVAKVRGRACLRRGELGSATRWLSQAKDTPMLRQLALRLLELLSSAPGPATLSRVGAALASARDTDAFDACPMLQFAALYHEFLALLAEVEASVDTMLSPAASDAPPALDIAALLHTAALRVHEMVLGAAPKRFWGHVLLAAHAAGLWEVSPAVLSVSHLQDLVRAFEDVTQVHHRADRYTAGLSADEVAAVRHGLSTALCTAVIDAASG